jgi:histidine ammonia-lyase
LFNAAQAIDFRLPLRTSPILQEIYDEYRKQVPFILNDELMYPYIEKSIQFLRNKMW